MKRLHIFSRDIINELPSFRDNFIRLETTAAIVSLLSGFCFGLTCSTVGIPFLAGCVPTVIIVYFILEMGVLAPTQSAGKNSNAPRIIFGVLLALINTIGIETVIFKSSIENSFDKKHIIEINKIDSLFSQKAIPFNNQIAAINLENDEVDSLIQLWSARIFNEVNKGGNGRPEGLGRFAKNYIQMWKKDSVRYSTILAENADKLAYLKGGLEKLNTERLNQQDKIATASEQGILDRIKMLHSILLQKNNYPMQVFFVAFFLLALCVELSTIYLKQKYKRSFDAYLTEQARQDEANKRKVEIEAKKQRELEQEQLDLEHDKKILAMQLKNKEDKAKMTTASKRNVKGIVIDHVRQDSDSENVLSKPELKKFRRKSIKSHLNGVSEDHMDTSEE